MTRIEKGKRDYEAHVKLRPTYHDGTKRRTWDELDTLIQWTWYKRYVDDMETGIKQC